MRVEGENEGRRTSVEEFEAWQAKVESLISDLDIQFSSVILSEGTMPVHPAVEGPPHSHLNSALWTL
jgi:hypothetical protein